MSIHDETSYQAARSTLQRAAKAYYQPQDNGGESLLSDADYDRLLAEIVAWEESHAVDEPIGRKVSAGSVSGGTVPHSVPMLSLENIIDDEARLRDWISQLGTTDVVVEPKLDGLAMSIHYVGGQPVRMLTRGDGLLGEDYTLAIPLIANLPRENGFTGEVRGEVLFSDEQFLESNAARRAQLGPDKGFANARNAASGTMARASRGNPIPEGTELTFLAYGMVADLGVSKHSEAMSVLSSLGFGTALGAMSHESHDIAEAPTRPAIGFECDGLVYKCNDLVDRERLGFTSLAPRWAKAYKFSQPAAFGKLLDVEWNVGRTGSVTPRAIISPTPVMGVTVRHATLNNPADIERKHLMIGDTLALQRAGAVIPEVIESVLADRDGTQRPIPVPTHCSSPGCGMPLDTSGARLRCPSGGECAPENALSYAASRAGLNIMGLSDAMCSLLVSSGLATSVDHLFDLTSEQVASLLTERTYSDTEDNRRLGRVGQHVPVGKTTAESLVASIEKARREATFDRVLVALSIAGTGRSMSKRLAEHFGTMDALLSAGVEDIAAVDKIGVKKSMVIVNQLASKTAVIERLRAHGLPMQQSAEPSQEGPRPLEGKSVVVTGSMTGPLAGNREQVQEVLERLGATVSSSVSKKTDLLIAGQGGGSKREKAAALGTRIVDEETFAKEFLSD